MLNANGGGVITVAMEQEHPAQQTKFPEVWGWVVSGLVVAVIFYAVYRVSTPDALEKMMSRFSIEQCWNDHLNKSGPDAATCEQLEKDFRQRYASPAQ